MSLRCLSAVAFSVALAACTPAGEEAQDSVEALTGGIVDRDAPASVVLLVPESSARRTCVGVAIASDAVLTSARCFPEHDLIGVGEHFNRVDVWGHADEVAVTKASPVRRVVLVGPKDAHGRPLLAIAFIEGSIIPSVLPMVTTALAAPVKIYGFGADRARAEPARTMGLIQSRDLAWGATKAVTTETELGAPLLRGNTVVGITVASGDDRLQWLDEKLGEQLAGGIWRMLPMSHDGLDVVLPLVATADDTSTAQEIANVVLQHSSRGVSAGFEDGPPRPARTEPTSCENPRDLGRLAGDDDAEPVTTRGTCTEWLRVQMVESRTAWLEGERPMSVRAKLFSPNADYDLFVYVDREKNVIACESPAATSTASLGVADAVDVTWGESFFTTLQDADDGRPVSIEVRAKDRAACAEGTWTLTLEGYR